MANFEGLLLWIQSFLRDDLGSVPLPPPIESKRLAIVDQLERIGRTAPALVIHAPAPPVQRRPLSTVARRLFTSSRKRFSLPASISLGPQLTEVCLPSSTACLQQQHSLNTEPPLPPRSKRNNTPTATEDVVATVNHSNLTDYEEPRSVIASSAASLVHRRRAPFARLSLSPQLEIVESHSPCIDEPRIAGGCPPDDISSHAPTHSQDDGSFDLTLPKRCLTTQARRFSAFMDPPWTLAGALHHRYKPNKWTRLNLCLLIGGSRLIAYRSGHSLTPSLVLFLCGSTGIYAGRDSGMDYVIKIAHSTRGMAVLAADTEEQALVWIKQINLYAQGITPSDRHSFLEQPTLLAPVVPGRSFVTDHQHADSCLSTTTAAAVGETQEDSGFSAPISSGSEGNSADGIVPCSQHPLSGISLDAASVLPYQTSDPHRSFHAVPAPTLTSTTPPLTESEQVRLRRKDKPPDTATATRPASLFSSGSGQKRRESLFSSMRRKVESFHSKRRARKSLPQSFVTPIPLEKANSSTDLRLSANQPHGMDAYSIPPPPPPPAAACVLNSPARVGPGFDWAQLESASTLFLGHSSDAAATTTTTTKPRRPYSFAVSGPDYGRYAHTATSPRLGRLLDLSAAEFQTVAPTTIAHPSQIIIAGEACISIPGKVPWTNRWCCLRSRCLDVYPLASRPVGSGEEPAYTDPQNNSWPLFSLSLEPGQVELGLAGDKRHKAAVRLAVPKQSSTPLLFDVPDKLRMGDWIRGFIQALGLIPSNDVSTEAKSVRPDVTSPAGNLTAHKPKQLDTPEEVMTCYDYDIPVGVESPPLVHRFSYNSTASQSQQKGDILLPFHVSGDVPHQLTQGSNTQIDAGSVNMYDEVCPSSSSQDPSSVFPFKRRWSSPSLPLEVTNRPRMHWTAASNLQSPSDPVRSWHIPPPSRRLLSQPLPPLPSVGPSGAESIAGTMTSSRTTSSSQTPEDRRANLCHCSSPGSEPELSLAAASFSVRARRRLSPSRHRKSQLMVPGDPHTPQSSPNQYCSPDRPKRHASLGRLEQRHYEKTPLPVASDSISPDVVCWLSKAAPSPTTSIHEPTNRISWSARSGCTVRAPSDLQDCSTSELTSTLQTAFTSETSLPLSTDHQPEFSAAPHLPWFNLSAQWWLDHMRTDNAAAARRSVSCVTGAKPSLIPTTDLRVVATTLPARHDPDHSAVMYPRVFGQLNSRRICDNWTSSSHTTATTTTSSSGVALTSSSGSSGTTRPGSQSALSWPPPTVLEEELVDGYLYPAELRACSPSGTEPVDHECSHNCEATNAEVNSPFPCATSTNEEDQPMPRLSAQMHRSPNNASLILVATQLEEVHQESKNLQSRRQTLSSRLSNSLARGRRHTVDGMLLDIPPSNKHVPNAVPALVGSVVDVKRITPDKADYPACEEPEEADEEEAMESLCARLAAIELLIHQAESTEAHLRKEFARCLQKSTGIRPTPNIPTPNNVPCKAAVNPQSVQTDVSQTAPSTTSQNSASILASPQRQQRRRRGRHGRNGPIAVDLDHVPDANRTPQSGGRGGGAASRGGGRSRRRNGGLGMRRDRRPHLDDGGRTWSKSANTSTCSVTISPTS